MSGAGEPLWLVRARDKIGLREISGRQHNQEIVDMARDARCQWIRDDETAWCSTFACAMLERSNVISPRNAAARSFATWGRDVFEDKKLARIPLGAIVVFSRPPNPNHGHVGFAVGFTAEGRIAVVGGNQGDSVSIAQFDVSRLITARWPLEHLDDVRLLRTIPLINSSGAVSANEA
jgi:uncharacterized protein (TIGR02594 family)